MNPEIEEKDLATYCGIYCGDCPRYNARFSNLAIDLLHELEKIHFSEFARLLNLAQYDSAITLLKFLPDLKCETPCRLGGDGCMPKSCEVKECIKDKAIEGCWDCGNFPTCDKLDFLKPFCGKAPIRNLKKIKEMGIQNWIKHREKQYPWM